MKTIKEIIDSKRPVDDIIQDLKVKKVKVKEWSELEKEYEPLLHPIITDKNKYPDKDIYDDAGKIIGSEPITRIAIGLQKLSAKRMGEFMFTTPVSLTCEDAKRNEDINEQFLALKKVLKRNRWDALNKRRCRITSSQCEQAVYWYLVPTEGEHNDYGFKCKFKLKHQIFSPASGDKLYPLFDDTGDMIAFSREVILEGADTQYFDCWTAENYYHWKKEGNANWVLWKSGKNDIPKIPIIYGYRDKPIWADADNGKVHEMELLLSRHGDIIAYHASPVLLLKGKLEGAPTKGEANKVFYSKDGSGDAKFAFWPQSPDAIKFQFEALKNQFFIELQLPDFSPENLKAIASASGEARKWALIDAHLKVGDESELYTDTNDREFNIIKAYLGKMNPVWASTIANLEVDAEIKPFTIQSRKEDIEVIIAANGGKPVISQKTSTELSGLVDDANTEYEQIELEKEKENQTSVFKATI